MKRIINAIIVYFLLFSTALAEDKNILGIPNDELREGEVDINDIPLAIQHIIDFLLSIAGTISVIFVVIGAYKILFGSLQSDKTKGRDTIIAALGGLALAALAWVIIKTILVNLS